jgi:hypothetical protein
MSEKGYTVVPKVYDPACAKQGMSQSDQGTHIFTALDEREALDNMVQSIPIVYSEDKQNIDGQDGAEDI